MKSKYLLHIYPRAQADMDDIFRYISEEMCNPSAAGDLIDEKSNPLILFV